MVDSHFFHKIRHRFNLRIYKKMHLQIDARAMTLYADRVGVIKRNKMCSGEYISQRNAVY